jgi:predicted nuclease of predicted toxin-antitoxin system
LRRYLNPRIAEALALVGYGIQSVQDAFGAHPQESILDPDIIEWCANHDSVLLTEDVSARRQFAEELKMSRISVVWFRKPKGGWSTKHQHRVITKVIGQVEEQLQSQSRRRATHFTVGAGERGQLKVAWQEPRGSGG